MNTYLEVYIIKKVVSLVFGHITTITASDNRRVPLGCANRCEGCRRGWRCSHRLRGDRSYHIIVSHSERGLSAKLGLLPDASGVFILFL